MKDKADSFALFDRYDRAVPRYTSYPAVPFWKGAPSSEVWYESISRSLSHEKAAWMAYVHMPFCESLCTFCGCTKIITSDHTKEDSYIDLVLTEFETYLRSSPLLRVRPLRGIHLGGGSPSFFSASSLQRLVDGILKHCHVDSASFEGSIEVDPRRAKIEQLKVLYDLGFRRMSLGVQDVNPEVQRLVNRHQPFELVENLTDAAYGLGYDSVNFDLIYGLPKQSVESIAHTAGEVLRLKPDRIAFYSLAYVPWIKPSQRLFKDDDLARGREKWDLYNVGKSQFMNAGYKQIGMDHFALPHDGLVKALDDGRLHRNFMGYTDQKTDVLLGLGLSSISETSDCLHQNSKDMDGYARSVQAGALPTHTGHQLSDEEKQVRQQVLSLMTKFEVNLTDTQLHDSALSLAISKFESDGLAIIRNNKLCVSHAGQPFVRVVAAEIDPKMKTLDPTKPIFSRAL